MPLFGFKQIKDRESPRGYGTEMFLISQKSTDVAVLSHLFLMI